MLLRKILNKKNHVRYSGIKIDENLNWKTHAQELASKLNKRNSLLSKLRHFVSSYILRSVYFAIYPVSYKLCLWGCTSYSKLKVSILQKKALRLINFAPFNAHTSPLFKICNILKFVDIVNVECCIFMNNCFNRDSFSSFNKHFKLASATHLYNTRSVRNGLLFISSYNSVRY